MSEFELLRKLIGVALNESEDWGRSHRLSALGRAMSLRVDYGRGWLSCECDLHGRLHEYDLIRICQWAIPSFRRFASVTLIDARAEKLVLWRRLSQLQTDAVLLAIETLLNQIEVWDQLLAAPVSPGASRVIRRCP
jgi:hypothetical protein